MFSRALAAERSARFLAGAAALVALTALAPPAEATEHNARVAEYLLLQHQDAGSRNARVAEHAGQDEDLQG